MTPGQDATPTADPISAGQVTAGPGPLPEYRIEQDIPYGVRIAAAWSWRVGLIMVVAGALVWLLGKVSFLVIPLMVASLLAGLLYPVTGWLRKLGMPQGVAVAITVLGFLGVIGGALTLVGRQLAVGFGELWQEALAGIQQVQGWLANGPLQLTADQIDKYVQDATAALQNNSSSILSGALSFGSTAGHFAAGMVLALFILIFFLLEGSRIWRFIVGLLPRTARAAADGAGQRGWSSMVSYVRIQMFVAFVDAFGIGVGAAIIQVPLALPLAVLVFIGSFIPVVGALVTGAIAVLLALVANGPVNALIMVAIVLFVQQIESHILQPLIMGKAVSLHPVAVILSVAAGSYLAGIPGALFAVPLLAVANTAVRYIAARTWEHDEGLMTAYAGAGNALRDSDEDPNFKKMHLPGATAPAQSNRGKGAVAQNTAAERTSPKDAADDINKGE
ncbi:AI-2E family transporter [Arthrobacter sp. MA-N2]|uniref:AI-2E family transporter n=1 Tax=Arthrobacter sp. MA-N2 TaxID=1101188 RepID=UPI0004832A61|nr:AI-2E family transporter [Arthrobacter sp. MA-N2]